MKSFEEIKKAPRLRIDRVTEDGFSGVVTFSLWSGSIICSTGAGWEHVSVSPFSKRFTPTWDNMCCIKDMVWKDDEAVIQIHPPKAEYVNNMPNCLHLWRCTYRNMILPPSILVGIRKGQTIEEAKAEIEEAFRIAEAKNEDLIRRSDAVDMLKELSETAKSEDAEMIALELASRIEMLPVVYPEVLAHGEGVLTVAEEEA